MKNFFCAVCFISAIGICKPSYTQVQKLRKPVDRKALEEFTKTPEIKPLALTPLNRQQSDRVSLFNAYLLKALLHRYDPKAYPMTSDENSIDRMALKIVNAIPQKRLDDKKQSLQKLADANDPRRLRMLGRFKDIDFTRPALSDIENIRTLDPKIFNIRPIFNFKRAFHPSQNTPPDYTSLDFIFRALHCVDETDPEWGTDDMILAGVLYELNTSFVSSNGFYCGEFNDGDYQQYGENVFASVPFSNNNYPKYYYCMLALVEQDTNVGGESLANAIRNALSGINGKVCESPSPDCNLVAGEMASILQSTIGSFYFFDDDLFPIYGVSVTINSKDEFGPGLQTDKLATAPISEHGGKYKIGYRWRLRK